MDVSHIWSGGFFQACVPAHKKMARCAAGIVLHRLHFHHGIFDRTGFKKEKALSLGLSKLPL